MSALSLLDFTRKQSLLYQESEEVMRAIETLSSYCEIRRVTARYLYRSKPSVTRGEEA